MPEFNKLFLAENVTFIENGTAIHVFDEAKGTSRVIDLLSTPHNINK